MPRGKHEPVSESDIRRVAELALTHTVAQIAAEFDWPYKRALRAKQKGPHADAQPFPCHHPATEENTYYYKMYPYRSGDAYMKRQCRLCQIARMRRVSAADEQRPTTKPMPHVSKVYLDKIAAIDARITAAGRCPVCHLHNPCNSSHDIREIAGNRQSITMPEPGGGCRL